MYGKDEKKLKMCYLFLALDGPMTEANLLKFTQMGENFSGFGESKDAIIAECNRVIDKSIDNDDRYNVISEEINKISEEIISMISWMGSYIKLPNFRDEVKEKQLLWMLVSLAWYDGKCTASEKKLICALMRKLEIDESVLIEMEDTAETMIALDSYRNWIKTTGESYDFINSVIQELDKNQKDISDNIACTINLG